MTATSAFLRTYEASMAQFTDAPGVYHTACAYGVYGALLSRYNYRCKLEGGMPARWTNIWILLEGEQGGPRKSTAISMAQDIVMRIDKDLLAPNDGSPEGFLNAMYRCDQTIPGNATTLMLAPEFSVQLSQMQRSYSLQLKSILMDLYDVPPVFKKALSKTTWSIPNPRVSVLGGLATELIPTLTTSGDWLGGFFSRFIIVHGERSRTQARLKTPPDKLMHSLSVDLHRNLKQWRIAQKKYKRPLFNYSKKGEKVALELPEPPNEPNLRGSLSRGPVHLMKVAAIEQIDEDPTAREIGPAAVERAMKFVNYWRSSVIEIIDSCYARSNADFEGDRLAMRIKRFLKGCPGREAQWGTVMQKCALDSDRMVRAVQSLLDAGLIEQEEAPVALGNAAQSKALGVIRLLPTEVS